MQKFTPSKNFRLPSSSTTPKIKLRTTKTTDTKHTNNIMAPFSTDSPPTSPLTDLSHSPTPPTSPSFWQGFSGPKPAGLNIQNAGRPSRKKNALQRYAETQFQPQRRANKRQRSESPEAFADDESAVIAAEPTRKKAKKSGELQFISYQPPPPTKSRFGRQSKPTQKASNLQSDSNGDLPTPPSTDDSLLSIPTSPQSSPISATRGKGKKKGKGKTPRPMTFAEIDAELDTRKDRKPMLWSAVQACKGSGGHLPPVTGPSAAGGICLPKLTAAELAAMEGASGIFKPIINAIEVQAAPYQSAFDDEIRAMAALGTRSSRKRARGSEATPAEPEQPAAKKFRMAPVNEPPRFSLSPESSVPVSSVRDEPAPHLDFGAGVISGFSNVRSSAPSPVSSVRDEPRILTTTPTSPNGTTNGYISPSSSSSNVIESVSPVTKEPALTTAAGNTPKKPTKVRFIVSPSSKQSSPKKSNSPSKGNSDTGKKPYVSPYVSLAEPVAYNGKPIYYLAYGVDMSPSYMSTHYPGSKFISTAKLTGHKWIIGTKDKVKAVPGKQEDNIWGALYSIQPTHLTHLITKGSKPPRSSRMLTLPVSLFTRNKKIGWFGNETEACLIPGPILQANVLVGKDGGEVVKLDRDNVIAKRLNRALVEICPEGVDSAWIEGVFRKWIARPTAGGGLYW